jgi:hypothetical protein
MKMVPLGRLVSRSRALARELLYYVPYCEDCGLLKEEIVDIPGFDPRYENMISEMECGDVKEVIEVHHINGNPFDNRYENLAALCQLCQGRLDHRQLPYKRANGWGFPGGKFEGFSEKEVGLLLADPWALLELGDKQDQKKQTWILNSNLNP